MTQEKFESALAPLTVVSRCLEMCVVFRDLPCRWKSRQLVFYSTSAIRSENENTNICHGCWIFIIKIGPVHCNIGASNSKFQVHMIIRSLNLQNRLIPSTLVRLYQEQETGYHFQPCRPNQKTSVHYHLVWGKKSWPCTFKPACKPVYWNVDKLHMQESSTDQGWRVYLQLEFRSTTLTVTKLTGGNRLLQANNLTKLSVTGSNAPCKVW